MAPVMGIAILAWILFALRCARRVHFAARRVIVDRSKSIRICDSAGRWQVGSVQDGSFVAPWLTIVRWRPEGAWFDRTVLVLPDMIAPEDFRHLRVLLRWC